MNLNISQVAVLAAHPNHPMGNPKQETSAKGDLDKVLDCFSEIDTESLKHEGNKIAYLEQMLRLQEPKHLSETQLSGRRFLLDMLSLMSELPDRQPTHEAAETTIGVGLPQHRFKYLIYLLERTTRDELAARVSEVEGIHDFDASELAALGQWLDRYGIDGRELALIQPNFFGGFRKEGQQESSFQGIHPHFAALAEASRERNCDYLAEAFVSLAEPLKLVPKAQAQQNSTPSTGHQGRGEALASIYDTPFDQKTATQTRLKAFFIPNRYGEPVIALSFVNEY
jgi:hypothetical protein